MTRSDPRGRRRPSTGRAAVATRRGVGHRRCALLRELNDGWLPARDRWFAPGIVRLEQAVGDADTPLGVVCGDTSPLAWFKRNPQTNAKGNLPCVI